MSFVNAVRSDIFFLSVTALICFVFDHLLCPAMRILLLLSVRRHPGQTVARVDVKMAEDAVDVHRGGVRDRKAIAS